VTFAHWANLANLSVFEVQQRFVYDHEYEQFERGEISSVEYWRHLRRLLRVDLTDIQFEQAFNALVLQPVAGMFELLSNYRRRFPVFALSNNNTSHWVRCQDVFPSEIGLFHEVFLSQEMGMRKPEERIYRQLERQTGFAGAQILFFDDVLANVQQANALGWQSVHVQSKADVDAALALIT
jgi:glucose-1-phosphatase